MNHNESIECQLTEDLFNCWREEKGCGDEEGGKDEEGHGPTRDDGPSLLLLLSLPSPPMED